MGDARETDASGNPILKDSGIWLRDSIKKRFKDADIKYIDPSYLIRSIPTTSNDRIYCKVCLPCAPAWWWCRANGDNSVSHPAALNDGMSCTVGTWSLQKTCRVYYCMAVQHSMQCHKADQACYWRPGPQASYQVLWRAQICTRCKAAKACTTKLPNVAHTKATSALLQQHPGLCRCWLTTRCTPPLLASQA